MSKPSAPDIVAELDRRINGLGRLKLMPADNADYSANINTARRLMYLIRALKEKP